MAALKPKEWVLPNRVGFVDWLYNTFHPTKYGVEETEGDTPEEGEADACNKPKGATIAPPTLVKPKAKDRLFPHQRFVKDYLSFESPYRGLLLYHSLGAGKSSASIAAAEGFVSRNRKVYVLLPAALEPNYRKEILAYARVGMAKRGSWHRVTVPSTLGPIEELVKLNGVAPEWLKARKEVWLPYVAEGNSQATLETKPWRQLAGEDKAAALETLNHMVDQRYIFISYNGISNTGITALGTRPFDNAFVVIDEAHNFMSRVTNGSLLSRRLYKLMMEAKGLKICLLSGTPMINHPFELCYTLNLIRGPQEITEFNLSKEVAVIPKLDAVETILEASDLLALIDELQVIEDTRRISVSLLPWGFQRTRASGDVASGIVKKPWPMPTPKVLEEIAATLVKGGIKINKVPTRSVGYALPDSRDKFESLFLDMKDPEDPHLKNTDMFMRRIQGLVSFYRSVGEDMFPRLLPTQEVDVPMVDFQFQKYTKVRAEERRLEKNKRSSGVFAAKNQVYRAFSRMTANFVFPEKDSTGAPMTREYPKDVRKSMLLREMDTSGEDADNTDETASDAGAEGETQAQAIDAKKKKELAEVKHRYEVSVTKVMKQLEDTPEALTTDALANLYSPKMAAIKEKLAASPGTALLYSQFRTCEGLGVLSLVLERDGWVELKVRKRQSASGGADAGADAEEAPVPKKKAPPPKKKAPVPVPEPEKKVVKAKGKGKGKAGAEDWEIVNADEVLQSKYNNKRFILFPEDRAVQAVMLNLFNGRFADLPGTIAESLKRNNQTTNLYGTFAKLLMITQSGAEGISLKNVRTVHILESFWNMVRINQVIGRAVRTCSHMDLPKPDRNVQVFFYISTFTPKQLKDDFTLRRKDNSQTTDQHILEVARRKDTIIQKFLDMLKMASVDCVKNNRENKIRADGLQCYSPPTNAAPSDQIYTPLLKQESEDDASRKLIKTKRWKGRAVMVGNRKMVQNPATGELYDYTAYMAGVAVPISGHA